MSILDIQDSCCRTTQLEDASFDGLRATVTQITLIRGDNRFHPNDVIFYGDAFYDQSEELLPVIE